MSLITPSNWIWLSKHGQDPYINMLARSVGARSMQDLDYEANDYPIVLRGIMKHKIMKRCWHDHRDFFYVDTGYLGNQATVTNPDANKIWHRIVRNDLQHQEIRARPADRWQKLGLSVPKWRPGRTVVVAAPDDKPCKFYGVDRQQWVSNIVTEIRLNTDRPIRVRERVKNRQERMISKPLGEDLQDAHVLVTYNSLAAVEAIMMGVPAIVLAPVHVAAVVSGTDITQVEDPPRVDQDLLYAWLCHLAYGQFHVSEMRSGRAVAMLLEAQ